MRRVEAPHCARRSRRRIRRAQLLESTRGERSRRSGWRHAGSMHGCPGAGKHSIENENNFQYIWVIWSRSRSQRCNSAELPAMRARAAHCSCPVVDVRGDRPSGSRAGRCISLKALWICCGRNIVAHAVRSDCGGLQCRGPMEWPPTWPAHMARNLTITPGRGS